MLSYDEISKTQFKEKYFTMGAPPEDLPPSYDSSLAPPPSTTAPSQPPTYDNVASRPSRANLSPRNQPLIFYLVGDQICPSHDVDKPLYQLNRPPSSGLRDVYHVSKVVYRLSDTGGEGRIRQKERRIYDFWSNFKMSVDVAGKTDSTATYKGVCVTSYSTLWSSCSVKEHFSCGRSMKARIKKDPALEWKSVSGEVLAFEHRGDEAAPPRLEMRAELPQKELDLLITCWCARVFRESVDVGKPKEEMSWEKCEYYREHMKLHNTLERKIADLFMKQSKTERRHIWRRTPEETQDAMGSGKDVLGGAHYSLTVNHIPPLH